MCQTASQHYARSRHRWSHSADEQSLQSAIVVNKNQKPIGPILHPDRAPTLPVQRPVPPILPEDIYIPAPMPAAAAGGCSSLNIVSTCSEHPSISVRVRPATAAAEAQHRYRPGITSPKRCLSLGQIGFPSLSMV
eukprot:2423034-Rhodomonas_salina.2